MYAHFGLTFSAFGTLEHGLANLLAVRLTEAETKPSRQKFDSHLNGCFQQTLGNLIKRLEQFYVGDEIIGSLRATKSRRDYLAHHLFREKAIDLFSREGMKRLLVELAVTRREIDRLADQTQSFVDARLKRMGLDTADFRRSVELRKQDLVRQARCE